MKKALIAIIIVIVAGVVVVATRPATFHIERSTEIGAPADIPFGMVNGFKKWEVWSPWEKLDPKMKRTFDGPESGVGAKYHWLSTDDKVGEGRMTLTELVPNQKLVFDLEFIAPMEAKQTTTFTFVSGGHPAVTLAASPLKTYVTWAIDGNHNFMGKAFGMFMDMDQMVGDDFQKGLATMKSAAEAEFAKRKEAAVAAPPEPAGPGEPADPPEPVKQ